MDLSIIIVNYNCASLTAACLDSVFALTAGVSFEVLVVDNGSTDDSGEVLGKDDRITFIEAGSNIGFGRANNLALEKAAGRNVLFLNPDTLLLNDACSILSAFLDNHPKAGACGGNLFWENGEPGPSFRRVRPGILWEINTFLRDVPARLLLRKNREFNFGTKPVRVGYVSGADLAVRREILDRVGAFSPEFFLYYEETELCARIASAGYRLYSVPSARILHYNGGVTGRKQTPRRKEQMVRSRGIYWRLTLGRLAFIPEAIWRLTVWSKKLLSRRGSEKWKEWNEYSEL